MNGYPWLGEGPARARACGNQACGDPLGHWKRRSITLRLLLLATSTFPNYDWNIAAPPTSREDTLDAPPFVPYQCAVCRRQAATRVVPRTRDLGMESLLESCAARFMVACKATDEVGAEAVSQKVGSRRFYSNINYVRGELQYQPLIASGVKFRI